VAANTRQSESIVAASTEILIGDPGGQHVLIRPLARSLPGLFDYSDGNWVVCEIEITAGGFRGQYRADLRSEEFQAFADEMSGLSTTLEGTAGFSTIEGQIGFSLTGEGNGVVRVEGEGADAPGTGNRLHFGFEIDQTYLPEISRALEALLAAFPVTGTAEA
jgi:hypothetical protein